MKKMNHLFWMIIAGLIFHSCSVKNTSKLLKKGSVNNTNYVEEVGFNYSKDLILVDVMIDGKIYNFIFDTGAEITVIGEHIINNFEYKTAFLSNVNAGETSQELTFIELPKLSISSVDFENTGAVIADIGHFDEFFGCKSIDGILGNNVMRKATWQIDYQNQKLTIADDIQKINVSEDASVVKMNAGKIKNVYFNITIGDAFAKFTFDTGFNGKMKADSSLFSLLKSLDENLTYSVDSGIVVKNLYGSVYGKTYYTMVQSINLKGIEVNNQIIELSANSSYLIGNQFFKNYTLTIDWNNDNLYFEPTTEIKNDTLKRYEFDFVPNFITKKFEIARFQVEHTHEASVSFDAQIIEIDGVDVSNFSLDELCEYWKTERNILKNKETLDIIVLDEGVKKKIKLTNKVLLPRND